MSNVAVNQLMTLEDYIVHFKLPVDREVVESKRLQILMRFRRLLTEEGYDLAEDYQDCRNALLEATSEENSGAVCITLDGCGRCHGCS